MTKYPYLRHFKPGLTERFKEAFKFSNRTETKFKNFYMNLTDALLNTFGADYIKIANYEDKQLLTMPKVTRDQGKRYRLAISSILERTLDVDSTPDTILELLKEPKCKLAGLGISTEPGNEFVWGIFLKDDELTSYKFLTFKIQSSKQGDPEFMIEELDDLRQSEHAHISNFGVYSNKYFYDLNEDLTQKYLNS